MKFVKYIPILAIITAFILIVINLLFLTKPPFSLSKDDYTKLRHKMVREQLQARGIKDERVLEAMRRVPRHKFVSVRLQRFAYADTPLPIGWKQTISQPFIAGLMTELLGLKGQERVLEIGTGSGYQTAILAELAKEVYTIEILKPLAMRAQRRLERLGYRNIHVKWGDGFQGWPQYAPFDAIIVTCAPKEVPPKLIEQLSEGGRLVIPVEQWWRKAQELKLIIKDKGEIRVENIAPVSFVPMIHADEARRSESSERLFPSSGDTSP